MHGVDLKLALLGAQMFTRHGRDINLFSGRTIALWHLVVRWCHGMYTAAHQGGLLQGKATPTIGVYGEPVYCTVTNSKIPHCLNRLLEQGGALISVKPLTTSRALSPLSRPRNSINQFGFEYGRAVA